mgnify:CR=1 FL=1
MEGCLSHRGPDGPGTALFDEGRGLHTGLAHRRLSIIDLSEDGRQPMEAPCERCRAHGGDLVLTYNGEIYNFRELRAEQNRDLDNTPYNRAFAESMQMVKDFWAVPEYAELLQQRREHVRLGNFVAERRAAIPVGAGRVDAACPARRLVAAVPHDLLCQGVLGAVGVGERGRAEALLHVPTRRRCHRVRAASPSRSTCRSPASRRPRRSPTPPIACFR